ncbi:hypothetical protein D4A92_21825 (plasmid) [Rhizobium rosettiformans]|uniref:DUF1835 domain-containing protein n=1 Tax=Rhizobium rosettiformans TaxID=1368430 RepID=A0ABX7F353_9HYPH|nr:hypothetical protein [Rhizobium rosettiformans]QRF54182.1 hypothetical protein D4A92_21825 [Rhizobium rosettiformans]
MQNRLRLTCNEAAAGYLKANQAIALVSAEIVPVSGHFIRSPVTRSNDSERNDQEVLPSSKPMMDRLLERFRSADRVELYIDPDPNSQLLMIYLLSQAIRANVNPSNLAIFQGTTPWGQQNAETSIDAVAPSMQVKEPHLSAAAAIWAAYAAATPQAFLRLDPQDLAPFPLMNRTREALLEDLPSADAGLGACEHLVLKTVAAQGCTVAKVASAFANDPIHLIDLPQIVDLVTALSTGASPVIDGLNGRLGADNFHVDGDACESYTRSHIRLTDYGHKIHSGELDFVKTHGIDRWWGGTRLKGHTAWRWDRKSRALISPEC